MYLSGHNPFYQASRGTPGKGKRSKKKGLDRSRPAGPGVTTGGLDHNRLPTDSSGPDFHTSTSLHINRSRWPRARPPARDGLHWGHALVCLCPFRAGGEALFGVRIGRVPSWRSFKHPSRRNSLPAARAEAYPRLAARAQLAVRGDVMYMEERHTTPTKTEGGREERPLRHPLAAFLPRLRSAAPVDCNSPIPLLPHRLPAAKLLGSRVTGSYTHVLD